MKFTEVLRFAVGAFLSATVLLAPAVADDAASSPGVKLQYRFSPGEEFRVKVTHLAAVDTKIRGVSEKTQTRAVSTKVWQINDIDDEGNITFVYSVEDVSMWQQLSDRPEIRYDSRKDKEPPPEYKHLADTVGVPIATVTISPAGRIVERDNKRPKFSSTIGELTILLPESMLQVGEQWTHEEEVSLRLKDMRVKKIKTRQLFTLEKVQSGVATISLKTQVLTPVEDPQVQSQLVQRVKQGEIKFDVDAGRILSQQMDVDETVIGFNGPDSIMKYLSRLTEEVVQQETVASGPPRAVN